MNTDIFPEAEYFLSSFLLGIAFLFCYDAFRILRRLLPHRWVAIAAEDILYWAAAGILAFRMVYERNYGTIRAYAAGGMVLGMWLYYSFLSGAYVSGVTRLFQKTGHLIYRFFYHLTYPIRFVVLKCTGFFKKISGRLSAQTEKKRLEQKQKQQQKEAQREKKKAERQQRQQEEQQKKEQQQKQKQLRKQQKEAQEEQQKQQKPEQEQQTQKQPRKRKQEKQSEPKSRHLDKAKKKKGTET